jgi:transcriptional regulator of acetoin/glycerol metabolism
MCFATNRKLRSAVAQGQFRSDLYHRIARPAVTLPPLRERRDELPWLISLVLRRRDAKLSAHAALVEGCMLRRWSGNVRELLAAVDEAADSALEEGEAVVALRHLSDDAGMGEGPPSLVRSLAPKALPDREAVERALSKHGGNVTVVAKTLKIHRTTLYRLMQRLGIAIPGREAK